MPIPLNHPLRQGTNAAPTTVIQSTWRGARNPLRTRCQTATASRPPASRGRRPGRIEWARYDHLMRPMVAYSPDARQIWRGVLAEIEISIGTKKIAFSLRTWPIA